MVGAGLVVYCCMWVLSNVSMVAFALFNLLYEKL